VDVAGGHGDIANALLAAGQRGIDGVFGEDDWIFILL